MVVTLSLVALSLQLLSTQTQAAGNSTPQHSTDLSTIFSTNLSTHFSGNFTADFMAPDSLSQGPDAVETAEYKLPAKIDPDVLPDVKTELWARVYWPKTLTTNPERRPLILLLHGNHPTCGFGIPRKDSNCSYTLEGTCGREEVIVPNHEGFNYLGQYLASHGYIAVSINANLGITCGSGDDKDSGLILARGRLVLRHLQALLTWSESGGAPTSLGLSSNAFVGQIDIGNVGLLGHSRGGEGVRAAYNLYLDAKSPWPARIPGLKIKGIFEIGSVDGQSSRVLDADDTAWNQLIPMCDGDVDDLQGRLPFERMILKLREKRRSPKSLYMVWGANHNFFNSEWHQSDAWDCYGHKSIYGLGPTSKEQQSIAIASVGAFFRSHVGSHRIPEFARNFDPQYSVPKSVLSITRIQRDHIPSFDVSVEARLEDFDQATGTNSNHQTNDAKDINIRHETELPSRARVNWQQSGGFLQLNWEPQNKGRDVSSYSAIDFRVARQSEFLNNFTPTDFSISLIDSSDRESTRLPVRNFSELLGPASSTVVYSTVRVPLHYFAGFDLKSIRGVRLTFDLSPNGAIFLANFRFSGVAPEFLSGRLSNLVMPIENQTPSGEGLISPLISLPPKLTPSKLQNAKIIGMRPISNSKYLNGNPGVEVGIRAQEDQFPVEDALPILVVNGDQFQVSRYPDNGLTHTLIFTIPRKDFDRLSSHSPSQIQYGPRNPHKVWVIPNFDKELLRNK
jgi:hypothetical protein